MQGYGKVFTWGVENLYQMESINNVNLSEFIHLIINEIGKIQTEKSTNVKISIHVKDVFLSVSRTATCALIINELITNSYKYGFPDNRGEK